MKHQRRRAFCCSHGKCQWCSLQLGAVRDSPAPWNLPERLRTVCPCIYLFSTIYLFSSPQIAELALWGCLGLRLQTLVAITFPKDTLMYYLVQIKYGLDIRGFIFCLFTSLLNSLISLFTFNLFLPLLLALYILKFQWIPFYPNNIFSVNVAKEITFFWLIISELILINACSPDG